MKDASQPSPVELCRKFLPNQDEREKVIRLINRFIHGEDAGYSLKRLPPLPNVKKKRKKRLHKRKKPTPSDFALAEPSPSPPDSAPSPLLKSTPSSELASAENPLEALIDLLNSGEIPSEPQVVDDATLFADSTSSLPSSLEIPPVHVVRTWSDVVSSGASSRSAVPGSPVASTLGRTSTSPASSPPLPRKNPSGTTASPSVPLIEGLVAVSESTANAVTSTTGRVTESEDSVEEEDNEESEEEKSLYVLSAMHDYLEQHFPKASEVNLQPQHFLGMGMVELSMGQLNELQDVLVNVYSKLVDCKVLSYACQRVRSNGQVELVRRQERAYLEESQKRLRDLEEMLQRGASNRS